jgi:hypothetical protein
MVCRELDDVEMLIFPFEALESALGSFRLAMFVVLYKSEIDPMIEVR